MNMIAAIKPAAVSRWEELRVAYEQARAAELAFDSGPYHAAIERAKRQGPCAVFDERWTDLSDRITDIRADAEDDLMAEPSRDAAGFALKYLIAKGDGRDTDKWDALLEREAKQITMGDGLSPLMAMLRERDDVLRRVNRFDLIDDGLNTALVDEAYAIECRIFSEPAKCPFDLLAKAMMQIVAASDGSINRAQARVILDEARALGIIEYAA